MPATTQSLRKLVSLAPDVTKNYQVLQAPLNKVPEVSKIFSNTPTPPQTHKTKFIVFS